MNSTLQIAQPGAHPGHAMTLKMPPAPKKTMAAIRAY
jgi:hypothetical protein